MYVPKELDPCPCHTESTVGSSQGKHKSPHSAERPESETVLDFTATFPGGLSLTLAIRVPITCVCVCVLKQ